MQSIPNRAGNKDLPINFFRQKLSPFNLSTKTDGPNPSEIDIKMRLSALTFNLLIQNCKTAEK